MNARQYLEQSGLLLEGVEKIGSETPMTSYSGFNVTKTDKEPIDQLQLFIAAKRLQEYNLLAFGNAGSYTAFIGGLFEVLNAKDDTELQATLRLNKPKELSKRNLFEKIYKIYDLQGQLLITADLWQDADYWNILKGLFDRQVMVRGLLINDALNFYENIDQLMATLRVKQLPSELVNLSEIFLRKIGNFPAPILYTPAEVSEAYYLQQKFGVNVKLGQAQERTYDKYISRDLSIFRLMQPVSLTSTQAKPKLVTPYIDKAVFELSGSRQNVERVYFTDNLDEIKAKIEPITVENYVFAFDEIYGQVFNPLIEKANFAVESARAMGQGSVVVDGVTFESGQEVVDAVLDGRLSVARLKEVLPDLLYKFTIKPFGGTR